MGFMCASLLRSLCTTVTVQRPLSGKEDGGMDSHGLSNAFLQSQFASGIVHIQRHFKTMYRMTRSVCSCVQDQLYNDQISF